MIVFLIGVSNILGWVMPYMLMYYGAILMGLLLITYIPVLSLFLPQAAGLL